MRYFFHLPYITKKLSFSSIFLLSGLLVPLISTSAHAVTGTEWKAGLIINDPTFYDNTSMSADDIQAYLSAKVPTCDTNGTQSAADIGYPNLTHAQYAAKVGWPGPPYVCLKDYRQVPRSDTIIDNFSGSTPTGAISAAQIIKNASDTYGVSPKALIVLLTKESPGPLTLDTWPLQNQYKNAMGYACPDTAPCDPQYAGFYNQVTNAAKRIQTYKQYPNSYRHKPFMINNQVYYNPNLNGCGWSSVYIEGYATAGLYNYTPYQPNKAALDNLYGTGDGCSAYGNRNFWRIWNDWFGPGQYAIRGGILEAYDRAGGASKLGDALMNEDCSLKDGACFQNFQRGAIYWTPSQSKGYVLIGAIQYKWNTAGKEWGSLGYPISDEIYGGEAIIQQFQNGLISYSQGHAHIILSQITPESYRGLGAPVNDTICGIRSQGCYQSFSKGNAYWSASTGSHPIIGGIGAKWESTGKEWGAMGYPTSGEEHFADRVKQAYEGGDIVYESTGAHYTLTKMQYLSQFTHLGNLRSDTICGLRSGGCYQVTGKGYIYQSDTTGAHAVFGGIYDQWAQTGKEWGSLGYPTSSEYYADNRVVQTFEKGSVFWSSQNGTSVQYK